ncbi:site-specific recombinase XerD [Halovivax ruber XH-70]|uniref:Site-specific recombinase XerD n=1 Tax=Halovivax ruber (strain DSM 18193 / JCM 13892 / XH-70) TaxID=797302 RepID=L0IBJ5_HALRX|nr:phage integrase SAM-like domain-containing protein [Halovivax ruber]AGB16193.1 site-specific recombinase XerD [Halovivax ruber XH-70]
MIPIAAGVDRYLDRKSVGEGAGTYAANASSILTRWTEWLEAEYDVETFADLERAHLEAYARYLSRRTTRDEYAASTARTYFAVVRAFLSWCVEESILSANPAEASRATAALPTPVESEAGGRSVERATYELEAEVRRLANEAPDGSTERLNRLREYAMIALLAHAGLRGGELFRVPEDDRRDGATWDDVDFYAGTIRVLGTSQELEDVSLPAGARTPLRRYRVALEPPTTDWPLFPTRHAPSIAATVREGLADRGFDPDEIDAAFESATASDLAREYGISPPAITTEGARTILKRLSQRVEIAVDGDYLTPGDARRAHDDRGERTAATGPQGGIRTRALEESLVAVDESADQRPDDPSTSHDADPEAHRDDEE